MHTQIDFFFRIIDSLRGAAASAPNAFERLPDPVDEATAMNILGNCFDRADWYVPSDKLICTA